MSHVVSGEVVTDTWRDVARAIDAPDGVGVRLTVAEFVPRDGAWEVAFAGRWGTDWSTVEPHPEPEASDTPALTATTYDTGWDDADGRCDMCGGPYAWPDRHALVFARPIALNRHSESPRLASESGPAPSEPLHG